MTVTRTGLQELSWQRLREARELARKRHWAGAYYLAGYVVEFALKAAIAKQTLRHQFPPTPKQVSEVYSHNLETLRRSAKLPPFDDPTLETNWTLAKDWSPESRYRSDISEAEAMDLVRAIGGRKGVFSWLRKYW
jgi:HEPN domain-containing protein